METYDDESSLAERIGAANVLTAPSVGMVTAKTVTSAKARKAAGAGTSLVLAPPVKRLSKGFLKGTKVKDLYIASHKLTAKSVKGSLKGSKVKTVKVYVSSKKKVNRKYAKKYKKCFAKSNSGKKVAVKYGWYSDSEDAFVYRKI